MITEHAGSVVGAALVCVPALRTSHGDFLRAEGGKASAGAELCIWSGAVGVERFVTDGADVYNGEARCTLSATVDGITTGRAEGTPAYWAHTV